MSQFRCNSPRPADRGARLPYGDPICLAESRRRQRMEAQDKEELVKARNALQRQIDILNCSRTVGGPHTAIINKLRSQRDEIDELLESKETGEA